MAAKTIFVTLRKSPNLCSSPVLFFTKRYVFEIRQLQKKGEIFSHVLAGDTKNETFGPTGPPLYT